MDDLELIKSKISVVDLIQEYLPLKKSGVNFKANCPFHNEKTPSFVVSPERGIWHCFGCDRGGDIFKFLMEKEGLTFPEALETLAQKAGVILKKNSQNKNDANAKLYQANTKAGQFFNYLLTSHALGKKALDYLKKRGLTDETIKTFQIGYAPKAWESLSKFLRKRGFSNKELIDSGLAIVSPKGCYDRFRGRIVFPLIDSRDRIIGFSGRVLDSSVPKYINTPQTNIFDKGRFLFGLNLAKGVIREKKQAILVEGPLDMILSYQVGVKNIVATQGTALTQFQTELLQKHTEVIDLCFDADLAGDEAVRRGIEIAERAGFNIQVVKLDGGKDPGEIILKDSSLWQKASSEAVPIYDYYLSSLERRYDLKSAFEKRKAFSEVAPIWRKIPDSVTKEYYTEKLSALLQIKVDLIREEVNKPISTAWKEQTSPRVSDTPQKEESPDRRKLLEEYLISLLLHLPLDYTYIPSFPETLLTQEHLRQIYVLLVLFLDNISFKSKSFKISEFVKTLPEELISLVDRLFLMQLDEKLLDSKHWQREVDESISELKKMLIKSSLEKLSLEIKNAQSFEKVETLETLNKRFRDLSVKLKSL